MAKGLLRPAVKGPERPSRLFSALLTWPNRVTPFFIAHGTADKTIPVERSRLLVESLKDLGIKYVYIEVEDGPHSFNLTPAGQDLRPALLDFLKENLGEPHQKS